MPRRPVYQLGPDDLVLSHFSLAPDHPVEKRIALAAANGIGAIGLYAGQYARLEAAGDAPGPLAEVLAEHDVALAEIEVVPGLGRDGVGGQRAAELEDVAWRMADAFGCRYLQVIGPVGDADGGRAFGALCDRAGDHGLVVGLEFLPFTDVVSVHDARRVVESADRSNGGVCVDIWHHERGALDLQALATAAADGLVTGIQVNDGTRQPADPDYYTDCLRHRVAPGDGEFDLHAFVEALRPAGVPWSIEVCSAAGWADPTTHVERIADGARRALARDPAA